MLLATVAISKTARVVLLNLAQIILKFQSDSLFLSGFNLWSLQCTVSPLVLSHLSDYISLPICCFLNTLGAFFFRAFAQTVPDVRNAFPPSICLAYSTCTSSNGLNVFSLMSSCLVAQSCLILFDPMYYSPPGSSVHGLSQARILEWVAVSSSRGPSQPRNGARISVSPTLAGRFFTISITHPQEKVPLNVGFPASGVQSSGEEQGFKTKHDGERLVGS